MDYSLLTEYGLAGLVIAGLSYFIFHQQNWVQKDLKSDLDSRDKIMHSILVKLISQIKLAQLDVKHLKGYVKAIMDIKDKK